MALIKCPECGKEISDKAKVCPNCGCPVEGHHVTENKAQPKEDYSSKYRKNNDKNGKKKKSRKGVIIVLVIAVVLIAAVAVGNNGSDNKNVAENSETVSISNSKQDEDSTTEVERESEDIAEETTTILETNISVEENNENYVEEAIENISYKVPESWAENKNTSGNNTYYRADSMLLMVQWGDVDLANLEELSDYERDVVKDGFTSSQSEGFELYDEKKNMFSNGISGHDYLDIEANVRLDDVDYVMYEATTLINGKWYVFGMLIELDSNGISEYKSSFQDVLSSVKEIENPAESSQNDKKDNKETEKVEQNQQESSGETTAIPADYKSALARAKTYSEMMHMSKAAIYDQLTSEYGDKFSADAAQYAVDNYTCDWKQNALKKAETYSESMHMSKAGIYDQLISEYGEQFTAEEAQYAVDNVEADWNANALEKAKTYRDSMNMSTQAIYDQLVSDYGEQFTTEEAQYAVDHLE